MSDVILPIRCALVGLGRHVTSNYMKFLLKNPDVAIVGICDLPNRRGQISALLPDVPFFVKVEDLVDAVDIDAAIISTPHQFHYQQGIVCLAKGVHVFMDKPLALSSPEAQTLIEQSKKSGKILFTALPRRYSALHQFIYNYVHSGQLGRIIDFDFAYYRSRYPDFASSWRNTKEGGGGVLIDAGCHIIDLLLSLNNSAVQTLKCQIEKQNFQVEVSAKVSARFENASIANVSLGLHGVDGVLQERIWIYGTEGALIFNRTKIAKDEERRNLFLIRSGAIERIEYNEKENIDLLPLIDFIDFIKSDKPRRPDLTNDLKVISFIEQAYHDAQLENKGR